MDVVPRRVHQRAAVVEVQQVRPPRRLERERVVERAEGRRHLVGARLALEGGDVVEEVGREGRRLLLARGAGVRHGGGGVARGAVLCCRHAQKFRAAELADISRSTLRSTRLCAEYESAAERALSLEILTRRTLSTHHNDRRQVPLLRHLRRQTPRARALGPAPGPSGALVDLSDEEDVRVAFVSHHGFGHPDPPPRSRQRVVRRLRWARRSCTTPDLRARLRPSVLFGEGGAEKLAFYFWIDYLSIPQPGAEGEQPKTWEPTMVERRGHASRRGRLSARTLLRGAGSAREAAAWRRRSTRSPRSSRVASDHLAHAAGAVPSTLRRVLRLQLWRTRGWCRMEARRSSRRATTNLMLIGSPSAIENDEGLEYFQPCDIVKLSVAQGTFTQESDRPKVNKTIKAMLVTKLDAYEKSGNYTLMRLLLAFAPAFLARRLSRASLTKKTRRPSEDSAPASVATSSSGACAGANVAEAAWQNRRDAPHARGGARRPRGGPGSLRSPTPRCCARRGRTACPATRRSTRSSPTTARHCSSPPPPSPRRRARGAPRRRRRREGRRAVRLRRGRVPPPGLRDRRQGREHQVLVDAYPEYVSSVPSFALARSTSRPRRASTSTRWWRCC